MITTCCNYKFKCLVRYVDNIDHQDLNGQTACHLASLNGEVDCINILLEQGRNKS